MEDNKPQVHDPMEEVNLGTMEKPRITYINFLLPTDLKEKIISPLQEFKDCFVWNYDEIPRLDMWNIAFPSSQSSILFSNHLEGCQRKYN